MRQRVGAKVWYRFTVGWKCLDRVSRGLRERFPGDVALTARGLDF